MQSAATRKEYGDYREYVREMDLSPRVKLAARLYGSGLAPTKKAASIAAGLHPQYLTMISSIGNEKVRNIIGEAEEAIRFKTEDISTLLARCGREGLHKIHALMGQSPDERIQLKAAMDLADRSNETSKVQKLASVGMSLSGDDVERLTRALVESAKVREEFKEAAEGDYIRVEQDGDVKALPNG